MFRDVIRGISGALRLVVPPEGVAVVGEQVAAVVEDVVDPDRRVGKVVVAPRNGVVAEIQRRLAADQNAVVEEEFRRAVAADRAARVVRNRDVRRGVQTAVGRRDSLFVPRNDDVGHRQLAAVVADRPVRTGVVHENRVGNRRDRVVPDIDRAAVRLGLVPVEVGAGNLGRRALFDEDCPAVRFGRVAGERAVGHRQIRTGRRVDRAAEFTGIGVRNRDVFERQIARVVDRAAVFQRAAVFDRNVRQARRAGIDVERAVGAVGADRDPAVPVDRDPRGAVDRNRAVGKRDRAGKSVDERDRDRYVERFGVGDRLAQRVDVVVRIDHVVERRYDERADDRLVDLPFERLGNRRDVVARLFARDGVFHRHVPNARFGRGELTRRRHRHVVVQVINVADLNLGVGCAVVLFADDRRAADRQLQRRDLAGHFVDFLFALDAGADLHEEGVRSRVARQRRVAPRLAVGGVLSPRDRAVETDRRLRLAVKDDARAVGVGDLFDRAQVERAAVIAVVADRVEFGVVIRRVPGAHRLVISEKRVAVFGEQIAAVVQNKMISERFVRKVVVAADRRIAAHEDGRVAADQNAVVKEESRAAVAANRAAAVVRNRDVRRGHRAAVGRRDPLLVPRNDDVDQVQLAAVVTNCTIWRGIFNKYRIRNINRRTVPRVERPAVRLRGVPAEIGTGNIGARPLLDENRPAVRLRCVVGERAVDDRQVRAGRRVDRAAVLAGVGIRNRHIDQRQIGGRRNRAAGLFGVAVFDGEVGQSRASGGNFKRAAFAAGVDRDRAAAVDGHPAVGGE